MAPAPQPVTARWRCAQVQLGVKLIYLCLSYFLPSAELSPYVLRRVPPGCPWTH
jgi:hypothetical protein